MKTLSLSEAKMKLSGLVKDELAGLRSFRAGRFRILYRAEKDIVELVAVGPRGRIYEETFLILKKEAREEKKRDRP